MQQCRVPGLVGQPGSPGQGVPADEDEVGLWVAEGTFLCWGEELEMVGKSGLELLSLCKTVAGSGAHVFCHCLDWDTPRVFSKDLKQFGSWHLAAGEMWWCASVCPRVKGRSLPCAAGMEPAGLCCDTSLQHRHEELHGF